MIASARGSLPQLPPDARYVDESFALSALPRRPFGAHKWGVGGLVIVAGGPGFIGAAALCAMAAGRSGAGIMNLAVPRAAMGTITTMVPEAAFIPLPDGDADVAVRRVLDLIRTKLEKSKAIVVGPGLGEDEYAATLLARLFGLRRGGRSQALGFQSRSEGTPAGDTDRSLVGGEKPAVVDADALNWLSKQAEWWSSPATGSLVLTPHVGEMARLLGCQPEDVVDDPIGAARDAAKRWHQVVVLKYGHSIATDGSHTLVADDAPTSLATAGAGDVLAGTIGAFLAQGLSPIDAAGLALYVGCRAARRIERRVGTLGLVASDLPTAIAEELAALETKRGTDHA